MTDPSRDTSERLGATAPTMRCWRLGGTATAVGDLHTALGPAASSRPQRHASTNPAVGMSRPAPGAAHPAGKPDECLAISADAELDCAPEGRVVYAPGSGHAPAITDRRAPILYALPAGAIDSDARMH